MQIDQTRGDDLTRAVENSIVVGCLDRGCYTLDTAVQNSYISHRLTAVVYQRSASKNDSVVCVHIIKKATKQSPIY